MTPQFKDFEHEKSDLDADGVSDRFELLSAYLDGELSPAARNQVQTWIDRDPQIKSLYTQLLALQGQMQSLDAPPSQTSTAEITDRVFQSLDRRRQRKYWLAGGAVAASLLAALTGILPGIVSPELRFARSPNINRPDSNSLMLAVAVNKPAINIPKSVNGF